MNQITIDPTLSQQLHSFGGVVELCDPSGKVVGRFVPVVDLNEWEPLTPEVSDEELDRRSKSKDKRYTTAEVTAHLEKL